MRTIDLTANKLQPLNGAEFTKATHLAHLTLSNNSGVVDANVIFDEMAKSLNTLNIVNCNIMQLNNNIFENVPSLIVLDLRDNPLESVIYEFKTHLAIKLYIRILYIFSTGSELGSIQILGKVTYTSNDIGGRKKFFEFV